MAGEGIPYRADTGGGVGATPDLRNPLGPPPILRPEDFVAMANFNDPTVALKNAADLTSSLIDNHYNNQIKYAQAQADLNKTAADTSYLGAHTDNINQATEQAKQLEPLKVQQESQLVQQNKYALDNAKRVADNTDTAWDEYGAWSAAVAKLDPNSNTYDDDLYNLNKQYPNASSNPSTMQTIKPLVDQQNYLRSLSSTHTLALTQQKELQVYQDNGLIPSDVDLRGQITQGNGQALISQAKRDASLQRLRTVQNLGTPQEQAWAQQQMDEITGRNYAPGDTPPPMFSPNGDLNTGTDLNLRRAEANIQARYGVVSPYAGMTKEIQRTTTTAAGQGKAGTTVTETIKGAPVTPGEEQTAAQPPAQPTPAPKPGTTPAQNPVAQQDAAAAAQLANDPLYQQVRRDVTSGALPTPQGTDSNTFIKEQYLARKAALGQPIPGRAPAAPAQGATQPAVTPAPAQPAVTPLPAAGGPIGPAPRGTRGKTGQVEEGAEDQNVSYVPIPSGGANTGTETLQPDFANKVDSWMEDMHAQGYNPRIVQAGRSPDYQAQLYQRHLAGGPQAAPPQSSFHSYGRAFDWVNVGPNGDLQWNNDAAYKAGQQIATAHGLRGLGESDNDHLEDASFKSWRDLPKNEYGRVAIRGRGTIEPIGTQIASGGPQPIGTTYSGAEQPVNYTVGQQDTPAIPQQIAARSQSQGAPAPVIIPAGSHTADASDFTFGPTTTFGLDYDGGIDRTDDGQGFYHQPNGQPYNTRDPRLVAASVPTQVMVERFGPSAADPNSALSRAISRGDIQIQVADSNGHIMQMPIADQGPSPTAPSRATLDLSHAASRAFQTGGNAVLGYRLVNRYGQPIVPTTTPAVAVAA